MINPDDRERGAPPELEPLVARPVKTERKTPDALSEEKFRRMSASAVKSASLGDIENTVQRLMNLSNVLEGTTLPPPLSAGTRIVTPTEFQVAMQEELEGGTRFILRWATPAEMLRYKPRYQVYAYYGQNNVVWASNQTYNTPDQLGPAVIVANTDTSPADFFIPNNQTRPVKFELEMRLGSGLLMVAEQRPSCTAIMSPIENFFRRDVTAAYAMTARDRVVRGDAAGGAFNITLPDPKSVPFGWWCDLRNSGAANDITIVPFGSETIESAGTLVRTPGQQAYLYTDNTNWWR